MKSIISLALFISCSTACVAQDLSNDITVKYSQSFYGSNESRIGLEYRTLGENFKVKLGSDYGKSDKSLWLGNSILSGSNSVVIYRHLASFSKNYSFYAGMDYEGIDYVSFGTSFILGTNHTVIGAYDGGASYDPESNEWVNCIECVYDYHEEVMPAGDNGGVSQWQYASAIKSTHYLVYGISLRAAFRIPIKNRFELTTGYEPTFVRNKSMNEVEYQPLDETYSGKSSAFNLFTHSATVALRYQF